MSSTTVVRHIQAPRDAVYRALLDARSLEAWRAPEGMTCVVHELDAREGGSFRVSLTYEEPTATGKTSANTDTYHGHFARLVPDEQVVEVLEFETESAGMNGEMTITTTLVDADGGTDLSIVHEGVPDGVSASDNELGTRMALDKLAALVESGRQPTSHERREGRPWDASYLDGPAPWDTGEPQPAIVRLAGAGAFAGAVLDAGCGTGENALHVAALGLRVLGVDVAETAVSIAREKAADRGVDADFAVADALRLDRLGRAFDTVLDCGLFHTFDGDERRDYVASLASVTSRGGNLYVLCFSDVGAGTRGPHPISQDELRAAFTPSGGWSVASIAPDRLQTRFAAEGAPAWLAKVERTG